MNEIVLSEKQLPGTLPELSKFVLVGREKLTAVRAEIRAIQKVGLAKEVHEQKLAEAQAIAEAVLDAEVQIGRLTSQMPKASGTRTDIEPVDNGVRRFEKPKKQSLEEIGLSERQANRFETLAKHPEAVKEAKEEARQNNDIVSRSSVFKKLEETKKPHVAFNSGNNEWYTPSEYIEAARYVMGSIDLDPASSEIANKVVKATHFYTAETNGLDKTWSGNIWMNPPYATDLIGRFISKLIDERDTYEQAIVLVNNATETEWFRTLVSKASAICFPRGRVKFYTPEGKTGAPLQGQAIVYIGNDCKRFFEAFNGIGWGCLTVGLQQ